LAIFPKIGMMEYQEINISASSDPAIGAENRSPDGSAFELTLSNAIRIPQRARNIQLSVEKATIWWSTPNVFETNNTIVVVDRRQRDANTGTLISPNVEAPDSNDWVRYEIRLLTGLYSAADIDSYVDRQIKSRTGEDQRLIEISGNTSYDRVEIKTKQPFISVDLDTRNSIASLLGFEPSIYSGINNGTLFVAPARVDLAPTDFYLIQCSLADEGMRVANRQSQIVAQVPITAVVGNLIVYEPLRPPLLSCEGLRAQPTRTIRFSLLKDDLTPANTNGNNWSVEVKVRYSMPLTR
jgi:hypothetical protein